jgi:hypothetical protein
MNLWSRRGRLALGVLGAVFGVLLLPLPTSAADGDFALQVTPSPLVTTIKPGVSSTSELRIRNAGTKSEDLKIETRAFKLSPTSGKVTLSERPADIDRWVGFSARTFHVDPGQVFTEKVVFNLPKESGFSYSFALVVSRQNEVRPTSQGRLIKGSVADFTLVNVDRPGATRKLDVIKLSADHTLYEFLPATFSLTLKNSGNTIVQPYGNIFVGRSADDKKPAATLAVNDQRGYILPGTSRTLSTGWNDGFPHYRVTTAGDGKQSRSLAIDWSQVSKLRIGKYTAKLVAVYDDGSGHDVPIEGEVSFWVIPWRTILLLIAFITALYFFFRWRSRKRTEKAVRRALEAAKQTKKEDVS